VLSRTVHIGNPAKLRLQDQQLMVEQNGEVSARIPIEDIGLVVVDHPQVTFSSALLRYLGKENVTVLFCDDQHLPTGLFQAYEGHTLMSGNVQMQIDCSEPLRKQLWKQTIEVKISNQAKLLERNGLGYSRLTHLATEVRSGDSSNREAAAAAMYWKLLFSPWEIKFRRDRFGGPPNSLLNYGYAILRSTVSKSIVAAGLLPMLGIHHRNSLNAFCLADDLMEPYRPFVDELVLEIMEAQKNPDLLELDVKTKRELLGLLVRDVYQKDAKTPLSVATERTCQTLARCFSGEKRRITYATFCEV